MKIHDPLDIHEKSAKYDLNQSYRILHFSRIKNSTNFFKKSVRQSEGTSRSRSYKTIQGHSRF